MGVDGDHNDDQLVNALDYVFWRANDSLDESQYITWRENYGQEPGGAGTGSAVPEPAGSLLLTIAALFIAGFRARLAQRSS